MITSLFPFPNTARIIESGVRAVYNRSRTM